MYRVLIAAAVLASLWACVEPQRPDETPAEDTRAVEARPVGTLGLNVAHMNPAVRPQDDFFAYVYGGWVESIEIPADRSRWGSFDELTERAEEDVLAILTEAAADTAAAVGSNTRKIGDLFISFMDEATIDSRGLAPLADALADIDALESHAALAAYWGNTRRTRSSAPLGFSVGQDQAQSDRYITIVGQSGLGLPDREYYLARDERSRLLLARYQAHITELFMLAGLPEPGQAAR
ncbi:MAG: M13 family peptidase, partial [Gammaproteobacteria bacterium]|nr:M13 family peptidase [Gammaproteobacteria bacterium]